MKSLKAALVTAITTIMILFGFISILFSCYLLRPYERQESVKGNFAYQPQHPTRQKRGNHFSITRLQTPNVTIPEGCIEAADKAQGWPIIPLGQCNNSFFFKFEQQVSVPTQDRTILKESTCNRGELKLVCYVKDFNHPAHFILSFLPCWSTWLESSSDGGNHTNKLTLVPKISRNILNNIYEYGWIRGIYLSLQNWHHGVYTISPFVRDLMDAFECTAEINTKGLKVKATPNNMCTQRVVIEESGCGWHFRTKKEKEGMKAYFFHPDHAYYFRDQVYSSLRRHDFSSWPAQASQQRDDSITTTTASPSCNVLFINRKTNRIIGGNVTPWLRKKLVEMGIPIERSNVLEVNDFGALDGWGQMKMMSDHDIIISPHGNQLSSIGLAPECASVLEIYPNKFAIPGFFLTWAVNAGLQAFGLHDGASISSTQEQLESKGYPTRLAVRDPHFLNIKAQEIVTVLPTLVEARRQCCQRLVDAKEWSRAVTARCV